MAAAAASGDKRGSVRLQKTAGGGLVVKDDDDGDGGDQFDDDDGGGSGGKSGGGGGGGGGGSGSGGARSGSARGRVDEAALRKAFEREKEWDETKHVLEQLKTEQLPKLQKETEALETTAKETKTALDQAPANAKPDLQRINDRAEARYKASAAQYAAELDAYKKLDALDGSMVGVAKEMETNAAARNSAAADKQKSLESALEEMEQRANALSQQMRQERTEYRKMNDMHVALARLAREKDESDRFEEERKKISDEAEKKRVEELAREMNRLAQEKEEQEKRVKQLADQMAAERMEKDKLLKLSAEKEKTEQLARDLAEQMRKEMEQQTKLTLEAKLARQQIEDEQKERARQSDELVKKIAEEKEAHEKARIELADKIKKQKEKHREFAAAVMDEKKRIAEEKASLQSKLKQLEDTLLEGDKKQKNEKLAVELQIRHAELQRQQKEAELLRAKAKADEVKDEYDAKVTDQSKLIKNLKKKLKAALEEIKDLQSEYDEDKEKYVLGCCVVLCRLVSSFTPAFIPTDLFVCWQPFNH